MWTSEAATFITRNRTEIEKKPIHQSAILYPVEEIRSLFTVTDLPIKHIIK